MQASPEGKLFGSVTNADIAGRFAAAGIEIERRKIAIAEPIKSTGEHAITVKLHREVQTPMVVKVVSSGEPGPVAEPEGLQTEEPRDDDDETE